MNAFPAANVMCWRPVTTVCADENRRVDFATKILQHYRKQPDCTRHVMRKLAQERSGLTAVDEHQFREREVRRQSNIVSFLPAMDFVEKTRQTMDFPVEIVFRFAWSQQRAVLFWQIQAVN